MTNSHFRLPRFSASVLSDGTLELMVYGEIVDSTTQALYEAYGINDGFVSATGVKKALDGASRHKKIRVRINSPGGDAFEGVAIYNILRGQEKPVETCVDGVAASSASIVVMAGSVRSMGRNAMMMVHNAWTCCAGYASDMRKTADMLDKVSASIAETYVERTSLTANEIKALMDAETWMSADDCLTAGFATKVGDDEETEERALDMARGFKAFAGMRNLPKQLRPMNGSDCECPCSPCSVSGDCDNCNHEGCDCEGCNPCPMKDDTGSNLSLFRAKLWATEHLHR